MVYLGKIRFGFFAFLLLVLGNTAFGQLDTTRVLAEVEILGQSEKGQTPSQTVRKSEFMKNGALNVADAIRNFSGVNLRDYGGIGGMKTISVRSLGASHTGVLIDGVPVTDSQNGQIDLGRTSIETLESITLYNAQPNSILLPASAFMHGSVVALNSAITPLDSAKNQQLTFKLKTGSFGLLSSDMTGVQRLGKSVNSPWYLKYSAGLEKATGKYGYRVEGDGSETDFQRSNADVDVKRYDFSVNHYSEDRTRFYFKVNYYDSERGLPGAVVYYNPISNQRLWNNDFFVQSAWEQKWGKLNSLVTGKYATNYTKYIDPDFQNNRGGLVNRYTQEELFGSVAFSYDPFDQLQIGNSSDVSSSSLVGSRVNFADPTRTTFQNATNVVFRKAEWDLQATLLFTRIDENLKIGVSPDVRQNLSPSVSFKYAPKNVESLQLRAFYKTIYRNPTFNDLYFTLVGERKLRPERAEQWNVGFQWSPYLQANFQLHWSGDAYFNRITDKIIALPNKDLFVWSMLNLGKVHIYGFETAAHARYVIKKGVKAIAKVNYTLQKAIDVTDPKAFNYKDQIPYTPVHTVNVNLGIETARLGIYLNHNLTSNRYYMSQNVSEYKLGGMNVNDFISRYSWHLGKLILGGSFEINNILNERYVVIRSFPMPGRSYRLGIQLTI